MNEYSPTRNQDRLTRTYNTYDHVSHDVVKMKSKQTGCGTMLNLIILQLKVKIKSDPYFTITKNQENQRRIKPTSTTAYVIRVETLATRYNESAVSSQNNV